jgi:predicted metallopeptidase
VSERRSQPRRVPLILRWQEPGAPLPVRAVRGVPPAPAPAEAAHSLHTGARERPFDFCAHMRRLLEDVVRRCPELRHIQTDRVLLGITQARGGRAHGLQARVTPLRFAHGALTRRRRGVTYQVQRYFLGKHEYLYLMTFCLPRFQDQAFDDKFVTLFHEMYHLSPTCDGDLRRHDGRYHLHTHDQHAYDRRMLELARTYLATRPDPRLHAFLHLNSAQLSARHGGLTGIVVPRPKIVPLLGSLANSAASAHLSASSDVE